MKFFTVLTLAAAVLAAPSELDPRGADDIEARGGKHDYCPPPPPPKGGGHHPYPPPRPPPKNNPKPPKGGDNNGNQCEQHQEAVCCNGGLISSTLCVVAGGGGQCNGEVYCCDAGAGNGVGGVIGINAFNCNQLRL